MNRILELNRVGENADTTFGVLSVVGWGDQIMPICNIIENSWQNNKADVSCIPKGVYMIVKCTTSKTTINGETFKVMGVPRRTQIKFHIGNTHYDTEGCPLTVSSWGRLIIKGISTLGGHSSRRAFGAFMDMMIGLDEATLIVK